MPFIQKIQTLLKYTVDSRVSKKFLLRYAIGQILAYSGCGRFVTFSTTYYRLRLTRSPIAMVLFGDPARTREEEDILDEILRPGDTAFDLGANIGTWTLRAAQVVGDAGSVYSFEAHPRTARIAASNIALNHIENATIVASAIGNESGTVQFSQNIYDDVNHVSRQKGSISVPTIRLDEFEPARERSRVRCIKLDVEGYEYFVLQGAEQTIRKTDFVIFEAYEMNCRRFSYSVDDLFAWFSARGFVLLDLRTKLPIDIRTTGRDAVANVLAQAQEARFISSEARV